MNRTTALFIQIVFAVLLAAPGARGGETVELSLGDAIARARTHSVSSEAALAQLRSAYWEYRTYRADLLPEVAFSAKIPSYYKQYSSYQNADGTYTFVPDNYMRMTGEISVSQNIWLTGGKLSINTSLDYLRQLSGNVGNRFMAIPVALTLSQPVFGTNNVRWNRRIEPVRYQEAKAEFLSATEDVAMQAISYFFELLLARENLAIARQNHDNATKLYDVAVEKRKMGRISKNDLLQMELNLLNAESDLTDCESGLKNAMFSLRSFLDYGEDTEIVPVAPGQLPPVDIVYADALDKALANNKFAKNIQRRQLEAQYEVAKAKGDLRQIELFAQVGLTGTGNAFRNAYDPLKDNQVVELGVKIPLLDWGKRRGRVKVAQSNQRLTESRLRQETQDFSQNLFILVERFNNQQRQLEIAGRSDTIAATRYSTNVETFMIGKISTLDLNDSQSAKDEARRQLLTELYRYWSYYYQIRSLTLWDYSAGHGIDADIEAIIRQ